MHVVSGQLKQPHVLVGDGIKRAAGEQDKWHTAGGHLGQPLQTTFKEARRKSEEGVINIVRIGMQMRED